MGIRKAILKLFGVREEPPQEYVHQDYCEQGRLVQGECASYRVYDSAVCRPVNNPCCAVPRSQYINGVMYPLGMTICGASIDVDKIEFEPDGQRVIQFQSHSE